MDERDDTQPEVADDEASAALPDLDVTDDSGDAVKGGVPKVER